jgi:hypothetical protein
LDFLVSFWSVFWDSEQEAREILADVGDFNANTMSGFMTSMGTLRQNNKEEKKWFLEYDHLYGFFVLIYFQVTCMKCSLIFPFWEIFLSPLLNRHNYVQ